VGTLRWWKEKYLRYRERGMVQFVLGLEDVHLYSLHPGGIKSAMTLKSIINPARLDPEHRLCPRHLSIRKEALRLKDLDDASMIESAVISHWRPKPK
jgi:hypothetical protein